MNPPDPFRRRPFDLDLDLGVKPSIKFSHANRAKVGVALLALLAIASAVRGVVEARRYYVSQESATGSERIPPRAILYEQRFRSVREALPPGAIAGYVTDLQEGERFLEPVALQEFFLAQHALAPTILIIGTAPSTVVGNFPQRSPSPEDVRVLRLRQELGVEQDFGDGVMLLGEVSR